MADTPITRITSTPRLPAELTDIIVDFLHNDDESLANCSLVCKAWLAAARYHVFGELLLHPWNVEAFVNLITHPSAIVNVVPYIHCLAIDQVISRHTDLFDGMFPGLRGFDFVRRLELQNIHCVNYEMLSVDGFISVFKSVTDLRLHNPVFDRPTISWYVVAQFPSLRRLAITNPMFHGDLSHLPPGYDFSDIVPDLRPPKIRDLVLSETDYSRTHILDWFFSRGTLVESLSVTLGTAALPSLNEYLQVLGPSLLSFQMDVHFELAGTCSSLFSSLLDSISQHRRVPFAVGSVLQHPFAKVVFLQLQFPVKPYPVVYDSIDVSENNIVISLRDRVHVRFAGRTGFLIGARERRNVHHAQFIDVDGS
jgi:hypothetical protein